MFMWMLAELGVQYEKWEVAFRVLQLALSLWLVRLQW